MVLILPWGGRSATWRRRCRIAAKPKFARRKGRQQSWRCGKSKSCRIRLISPDFTPWDFWTFNDTKRKLRGIEFHTKLLIKKKWRDPGVLWNQAFFWWNQPSREFLLIKQTLEFIRSMTLNVLYHSWILSLYEGVQKIYLPCFLHFIDCTVKWSDCSWGMGCGL